MVKRKHYPVALAVLLCAGASFLTSPGASAQSILDGIYNPIIDEDVQEREPGPEKGEYVGLPVTAAARTVAGSYNPEDLTLFDWQCRPHPSFFGIREIGQLRIWQEVDPQTLQQVEVHTMIVSPQRDIWMDKRPHPPAWAPHTWQGFSVGQWEGDVLHVHTDTYKRAYLRRNGVPSSDQLSFDEYFFRDGDLLTHIEIITDPEYLTEPVVKSTEFRATTNVPGFSPYDCRPLTEVVRKRGDMPMDLPNQTAANQEWAVSHQVPLQASLGGADTLLPEYQDTMKTLPPNPSLDSIKKLEQAQEQQH